VGEDLGELQTSHLGLVQDGALLEVDDTRDENGEEECDGDHYVAGELRAEAQVPITPD
jgi:hypothetical protein